MLLRNKLYLAMLTAMTSVPALASPAKDGNEIVVNIVRFLGSIGYGLLALMVLIGLYCIYVFGTSLFKMGDDTQRDQVKPKTLVTSLCGALVLTYGSYVLGVAMQTAFGGNADSAASTTSAFDTAPTTN